MFEQVNDTQVTDPVLSSAALASLVDQLRTVDQNAPDPELIDQITELERLKSAYAAAQAALTLKHPGFDAPFVTSERPVGPH